MGFIFLLLAICVLIGLAVAIGNSDMADFVWPFSIAGAIYSIILFVVLMVSYESTIGMKQRIVNIHAYKTTIEAYVKIAKSFESKPSSELTDLKYQSYQKQIATLLRELRREIVKYNNEFIGKRAYNESLFWSWVIFESPPGAHELKMQDYLE